MSKVRAILIFIFFTTALFFKCILLLHAQPSLNPEAPVIREQGEAYLRSRVKALEKSLDHSARIQERLLKKLEKQEAGISGMLAKKQSDFFSAYKKETLTYDSIAKLARDTASLYNQGAPAKNSLIDSLKGIQRFIQKQSGTLQQLSSTAGQPGRSAGYTEKLNRLQQELNAQEQLQKLIDQRGERLGSLLQGRDIPGLKSMQKNIYYAGEKIKSWKQLAREPDEAEARALEYLRGVEGFESYLRRGRDAFGGLGNHASAEDLERLGYQTKSQVKGMLQERFGDQLGSVQQQMGKEIEQYQKELSRIREQVNEVKAGYAEARQTLDAARQAKDRIADLQPTFKRNPERGRPFWQRFEIQYAFQATRSIDKRPALLNLGISAAFKHTPKFRIGIGIAADLGLGKDWQHLALSYEGISLRAFLDRELIYGISLQGGYERILRPGNRAYLDKEPKQSPNEAEPGNNIFREAFGGQQQAAYLGLMKRYRINSKWNGTFMIGYNFLWEEYHMRSPLMIRLGWAQ